jgi:hypothetical protein
MTAEKTNKIIEEIIKKWKEDNKIEYLEDAGGEKWRDLSRRCFEAGQKAQQKKTDDEIKKAIQKRK